MRGPRKTKEELEARKAAAIERAAAAAAAGQSPKVFLGGLSQPPKLTGACIPPSGNFLGRNNPKKSEAAAISANFAAAVARVTSTLHPIAAASGRQFAYRPEEESDAQHLPIHHLGLGKFTVEVPNLSETPEPRLGPIPEVAKEDDDVLDLALSQEDQVEENITSHPETASSTSALTSNTHDGQRLSSKRSSSSSRRPDSSPERRQSRSKSRGDSWWRSSHKEFEHPSASTSLRVPSRRRNRSPEPVRKKLKSVVTLIAPSRHDSPVRASRSRKERSPSRRTVPQARTRVTTTASPPSSRTKGARKQDY